MYRRTHRVMPVTAALLCAVAISRVGAATDWPSFRGPDGDGISKEKGINKNWRAKPPKELWRVSLSDSGYAGPSAADGKVFIIDHEGSNDVVRALDLGTGGELWRFSYADAAKNKYGFARSTPTFDEGKVYTFSRPGKLHCLDAGTGRKVWMVDVKKTFGGQAPKWEYSGSPFVDGDKLIVGVGGPGAAVVALDKKTGRTIWRGGGSDKPGYATPFRAKIAGREQYVVSTAKGAMGVDVRTGRTLWKAPWPTRYDVNAAAPLVIGNNVFVTSGYKTGCGMFAVSASGARLAWKNKEIQSHFNSPVQAGGYIYCTSDPSRLVCMDARTGRVAWSKQGFQKGGLVAVDGTLIVCDGKTGDVAMVELKPTAYRELGRIKPLGGQSWTAPIVADGKLIVRNKNAMVCLDIR